MRKLRATARVSQGCSTTQSDSRVVCHAAGEHFIVRVRSIVDLSLINLYSAIYHFEVMVELGSGEYKTTASPVNVEKLMNQLVLSTGHDKFSIEISSQISLSPSTILFDEKMAQIILQNVLTNAVAHGDSGNIEFKADLRVKGAH